MGAVGPRDAEVKARQEALYSGPPAREQSNEGGRVDNRTAAGATQGEEARAELAPEHAADASAEDWSWQSEITARGGTSSAIDEPH